MGAYLDLMGVLRVTVRYIQSLTFLGDYSALRTYLELMIKYLELLGCVQTSFDRILR